MWDARCGFAVAASALQLVRHGCDGEGNVQALDVAAVSLRPAGIEHTAVLLVPFCKVEGTRVHPSPYETGTHAAGLWYRGI